MGESFDKKKKKINDLEPKYKKLHATIVNLDNAINFLDVVMLVGMINGGQDGTSQQWANADFNQDGIVDILDVVQIVNLINGNI